MRAAQFLERRAPAWDRLEELVGRAGEKGLTALSQEELHELTRLYRAVAVDVARARTHDVSSRTRRRINSLAVSAHGLLYRRPARRPLRALWQFFSRDYPRLFRRLWAFSALAFAIFFIAGLGAYLAARVRPGVAHLLVPGDPATIGRTPGKLTAKDISERFRTIPQPPMAAIIVTNNIRVALTAFAFGITAGLGTCLILLVNALMLGGLAAHFANHGLSFAFWSFILGHGVLEIMAVLLAGAAGLRLGLSLAIPGGLTRKASLRVGAKEALLLLLGTIPMFAVAAAVESFVTPTELDGLLKMALGVALGLAALAYLLLAGRRPDAGEEGTLTGARPT